MKKQLFTLLLAAAMLLGVFSGCGTTGSGSALSESSAASSYAEATSEEAAVSAELPALTESAAENASAEESASAEDAAEPAESDAAMGSTEFKEMLKGLTTELPITEEDVTLTYFLGFETATLNYIPSGELMDHQVWSWLRENTGVTVELQVVDKTNETDKFNLMIASGDYTDFLTAGSFSAGIGSAYDDDIVLDLGDYLEDNMPNYWTIINSDQELLDDVQDADKFLAVYAIKNEIANPSGEGTFIRKDWLEDLGLDVPQTYEELTEVLRAFKTEKGASEPMCLFNTVSMNNGLLMGGFGSIATLSADSMGGSALSGYYQEDGTVIYGATADGTRKYLSWLNELYKEELIDFDNMLARETNPFSDLNAGEAADGSTGYIFSNQPFGGNYSTMAAEQYGDSACNWWPVQDVAEEAGQTIPFYEENSLKEVFSLAISSQCENVETALQFLDYGYSYEGSVLYNFGFQIGSGHDTETWSYDENGDPKFDAVALSEVADSTNQASSVIATKDLAGITFDNRLSFEFGERELSCFSAWSTNKTTDNILGADVVFTSEESTEAASIYSDIMTYVGTVVLQFINGDLDINDDTVWESYVETVESMNLDAVTELVQTAYDRVN